MLLFCQNLNYPSFQLSKAIQKNHESTQRKIFVSVEQNTTHGELNAQSKAELVWFYSLLPQEYELVGKTLRCYRSDRRWH